MHRTSSVFYLSDYSIRRPISSILQFFSDLKCCLDRIRKGYCLWEIDTWFLNVMPDMLEEFNRCKNSYPQTFLEQYIQKHEKERLQRTQGNSRNFMYFQKGQNFMKKWEAYEAYGNGRLDALVWKLKDGWEYRLQCRKKALEMFQTYFNDLWD